MAEKTLEGLLNNITGSDYPNPVAGFIPDQSGMNNQIAFDKLTGAADQYVKSRNDGSGTATTLLRMLQGSKAAGLNTQNIYLNALKGQQQLTKGMLDVQKIQAELTKLGFTNAKLARLDATERKIILNALLKGDYDTIQKISLLGGEKYGERLYPELDKVPYDVAQFNELIKNLPKLEQNKLRLEYINAATPKEKAEIQNKIVKDIQIEFPSAVQYTNTPSSNLDIVDNLTKRITTQNTQPINQSSQYIPPMEVGIPSTTLNKSPDVASYKLGGYNTAVNNNVPVSNDFINNTSPNEDTNLTQKVINNNNRISSINNYRKNQSLENGEQRYNNIPQNYEIKSGKHKGKMLHDAFNLQPVLPEGLVAGQEFSIKELQTLKKDAPNKLQGASKSVEQLNELHQNLSQLIYHKGFENLFSKGGDITSLVENDAINARKLFQKIQKTIGKIDLVQMKLDSPNGATPFGQLNFSELQMMLDSITEAEFGGSPENAMNAMMALGEKLNVMKSDVRDFNNLLYKDSNDKAWQTYGSQINYNYIESPEIEGLDGEKIVTGAVMNSHTGTSKFDRQNYYFMTPDEDGMFDTVINPKTNKILTIDDIKNNRY